MFDQISKMDAHRAAVSSFDCVPPSLETTTTATMVTIMFVVQSDKTKDLVAIFKPVLLLFLSSLTIELLNTYN